MRVLLMGSRNAGYYCLKYLIDEGEAVVGVVVPPEETKEDTWYKSVKRLALRNKLSVYSPKRLNDKEFTEIIRNLRPDVIFSCYYTKIIPKEILDIPTYGRINFHGALLPRYRGCFSGAWSIINDEKVTGVTMHYMEPATDTGDIIAVKKVEITNEDTARTLYEKVSDATISLFKEKWPLLKERGRLPVSPQNHEDARYYGRAVPFNRQINWNKTSREICNFIRALNFPPFPAAVTHHRGRELMIWEAQEMDKASKSGEPGKVTRIVDNEGFMVATKDGSILIKEVQHFDEEKMNGADYVSKYNVKVGELLGK